MATAPQQRPTTKTKWQKRPFASFTDRSPATRKKKVNHTHTHTHFFVDGTGPTMIIIVSIPDTRPLHHFVDPLAKWDSFLASVDASVATQSTETPMRGNHTSDQSEPPPSPLPLPPSNTFEKNHDKEEIIIKLWIISSSAIYFSFIRN